MKALRVLVPGSGAGPVLRLTADLSFWGAVDPASGRIIDQRHPQHGESLAGRVVVLGRSVGSSSGSAVLLELLRLGCGPAAIILGEADQILTLGAVVAVEMGYASLPVLLVEASELAGLAGWARIDEAGEIELSPGPEPPSD